MESDDSGDGDQNMFEDLRGSEASSSDDGEAKSKKRSGNDREFKNKGKVH